MESANLHLHQLQGQLAPGSSSSSASSSSSSSLSTPSSYGVAASPHAWTHNITLSSGNPNSHGAPTKLKNETISSPSLLNNSIIQDLGFPWTIYSSNAAPASLTNYQSSYHHDHDLKNLGKIKEEDQIPDFFPKFTQMLNCNATASSIDQDSHYIKDEQTYMTDLNEKLLLKTISSGFPINGNHQFLPSEIYSSFGSSIPSRGNFSQIYPSINISNLNQSPPPSIWGSFDMNLQALDLLASARFSGRFGQPCHENNLSIYDDNISYDLDRLQPSNHWPSCSPSKITSFSTNEIITKTKRPNSSLMEPKATTIQAAPKKSRLETRASCPPFKVRKEKLGDRIAALQQLVAPFGKTDTASVLMEAIGYIKFLQNQVETLSVPYMNSSGNNNSKNAQTGSTREKGVSEAKNDLRSRGLCLVPLTCISYVTGGDGGGGMWPPEAYGRY